MLVPFPINENTQYHAVSICSRLGTYKFYASPKTDSAVEEGSSETRIAQHLARYYSLPLYTLHLSRTDVFGVGYS
jgi:hypothetical protein